MNNPLVLRVPTHVKAFSCTQCGTCCTNKWKIDIDDLSFSKLYKPFAALGKERELYDAMLFRHKGQQIRFLANGKCPFLNANNLCNIQLQFGTECMGDICNLYPRRIFSSPRGLEFALSLSCTTAVRTLCLPQITIEQLNHPAADAAETPFKFTAPNSYEEYSPPSFPVHDLRRKYYQLEDIYIMLLQNRQYSISQRLTALGTLIDLLANSNYVCTKNITNNLETILQNNSNHKPTIQIHLQQLHLIINSYLTRSIPQNRPPKPVKCPNSSSIFSTEIITPFQIALNMLCTNILTLNHEEYRELLTKYYYPNSDKLSIILENYFVNFILNKNFFFQTPQIAYYKMTFSYAIAIASALAYCRAAEQLIDKDIMLEAIFNIENIFYPEWFYPYANSLYLHYGATWLMANSLALANI